MSDLQAFSAKFFKLLKKFLMFFTIFLIVLIAIIVTLIFSFIIYIDHPVPKVFYKIELNSLKKQYGSKRLEHFPEKIPKNARNYYFHVEHSWDISVDYMYFDTDKTYIKSIENKYKKKCIAYDSKDKIFSKYSYPHTPDLDNDSIVCLFKDPYSQRYINGYAIKDDRIYFFYEGW